MKTTVQLQKPLRRYDCVRGAERDLGVATGQVCKNLKGIKPTVKGLVFKYAKQQF